MRRSDTTFGASTQSSRVKSAPFLKHLPFMKHLPNAITIIRIVLTPIFLVVLTIPTLAGRLGALALFVIAAISDYYDGKLARSYQVRTRLGQFLDPFADKVLVLGAFIALAVMLPDTVPFWAVALIALRDVTVTSLRTWKESRGRTLRTLSLAKTKTAVQLTYLIGMLTLLAAVQFPEGIVYDAGAAILYSFVPYVLLLAVTAFTVLTGAQYFYRGESVTTADDIHT